MNIKLMDLLLENFKGVGQFALNVNGNGQNAIIKGNNGTGKTTLMDAFLWLLFGKNSLGKSDFAIKTLDENGQEIHNLDHSVEGHFEIDGTPLTLRKVFHEDYTKKRGTSSSVFTGHSTDYYIDGVPVQKKKWDKRIAEIVDENTAKLLTDPAHFNSLHWQKRREILLDVCGDISDSDIINSDKSLAGLPDIINGHNIDDHKTIIAASKKKINDRLKEIPARIDELSKSIVDTSGYKIDVINSSIKDLEEQIETTKEDKTGATLRSQKAELQAKLSEAKTARQEAIRTATKDKDKAIEDLEDTLRTTEKKREQLKEDITDAKRKIESNTGRMDALRRQYAEVAEQCFEGDTVCPACGQSLPADQVEKATEQFNSQKASHLEGINADGKKLKKENEDILDQKKIFDTSKSDLTKQITDLDLKLGAARENRENVFSAAGEKEDAQIQKIEKMIEDLNNTIASNLPSNTTDLELNLQAERTKLAEIDAAKKTRIRILELTEEEKKLTAEYEDLEKQTFLIEKFIIEKVGMLEGKINDAFEIARFKLFDKQINGGINETCVTLFDGVPFGSGLNTGAEINVGLDIIKTLSAHYNIKIPVWIDHAESVTKFIDIDTQIFKLVVADDHDTLEVNYYE